MSESDRLISATMMYDVFEHHALSLKRSFVAWFLAGYGIFYVLQLISSPKGFVFASSNISPFTNKESNMKSFVLINLNI